MARIIVYDEGHSLERVLLDLPSENTPDYDGRTDVVINPDTSGLVEPMLYWRHDSGTIRDMDSGEKATFDAEISAALLAYKRDGAKSAVDLSGVEGYKLRAVVELMVRELNILRERERDFQAVVAASGNLGALKDAVALWPSLSDRTLAQARAAYIALINEGAADG